MIWIDGQLRGCDATVSVFDRGFLYGDGLFETLPVYAGRPFLLDDHLARLMHGTQVLRMTNAPGIDDWRAAVSALLDAERPDCATLRLWISRGVNTGIGLGCGAATRPTWIAACLPARRYDARIYDEGMVLALSTREHALPSQSPTGTKHANYLASILAFDDAHNAGADEALLCNPRGNLCEGAFSNLFAVIDDVLVTPPLDLSGLSDPIVRYWRWYSNDYNGVQDDVLVVQVSNGGAWLTVETVGPTGPETSGGWFQHAFRVADFVLPSPRAGFCLMGACQDCWVVVAGLGRVRACATLAQHGMEVRRA